MNNKKKYNYNKNNNNNYKSEQKNIYSILIWNHYLIKLMNILIILLRLKNRINKWTKFKIRNLIKLFLKIFNIQIRLLKS